jgi:hypothetical protein
MLSLHFEYKLCIVVVMRFSLGSGCTTHGSYDSDNTNTAAAAAAVVSSGNSSSGSNTSIQCCSTR